jgi:hypothetical protein
MSRITRLKDLTIALNGTDSRIVGFDELRDAKAFGLRAPAVLAEGVTINVTTDDPPVAGSTWTPWNNGVADIAAPAAGKATSYPEFCFTGLKLVADAGVAADRTFGFTKLSSE